MAKRKGILKAPFPYFGGKSKVADLVWERFGDVGNYVEPFFGSGAVLLAAPQDTGRMEVVNDADGFLVNFWRAVQSEPEAVADLMNYPVFELDIEARHKYLVAMPDKLQFLNRIRDDFKYYDVERAAYWCWGLCTWIGGGWCAGEWYGRDDENNRGTGINGGVAKRGVGVYKKIPSMDGGRGVGRRGLVDQGVYAGVCDFTGDALRQWMNALCDRMRRIRVCCGDWSRVMGPAVVQPHRIAAVFLDPPYSREAGRTDVIYREEDLFVAHKVREWCLAHGSDRRLRLALCGYEGEGHEELEDHGWSVVAYKTQGGMGVGNLKSGEHVNKYRERIWFSPHCMRSRRASMGLDLYRHKLKGLESKAEK